MASLYSYVISHRSYGSELKAPFSIALVTLAEGPRIVSNIVDCEQTPEALVVDMPLELTFRESNDGFMLPVFCPTTSPDRAPR
jgi:uncharacterized OB-fold protein